MEVIREELELVREQFGDKRRTEITANSADINLEDLITQEDVVVTLSHQGYVKYQPLSEYAAQRRGGKGKSAARLKEEDFIDRLLVANTHDHILCFSSRGRVYSLKVYQLPEATRGARGRPIVNLLPLEQDERITAILPVTDIDRLLVANTHDHILCFSSRGRVYSMKVYQLPEATRGARGRPIVNLLPLEQDERITAILPVTEFEEGVKVFMATANGTVKKTVLTEFNRLRTAGKVAIKLVDGDELIGVDLTSGEDAGKVAIKLVDGDELIGVDLTSGEDEVMLFSAEGKVVRFKESSVRAMV